jgi:hypothetical protein
MEEFARSDPDGCTGDSALRSLPAPELPTFTVLHPSGSTLSANRALLMRGGGGTVLASLLIASVVGAAEHAALDAAVLEMRGEFAAVREQLAPLISRQVPEAGALFVAACIEIEEGNLDAATAHVAQLATSPASSGHASVLAALIDRRRRDGKEPLRLATIEAWKAAGRPDLGSHPLPGLDLSDSALEAIPPITPEQSTTMTPGDKLLFITGPSTTATRLESAIAATADSASNRPVVNYEVLVELALQAPFTPERAPSAMDGVRKAGDALVRSDPDNGYFQVAAWLASGSPQRGLSIDDLDALERAVAKPRFEYPRAVFLAQLRAMARRWDPLHADMRAVAAGLAGGNAVSVLWLDDSPQGKALRAGVSSLLRSIGSRLEASPTILDRMLALALQAKGAKLSGDPALQASTKGRFDEFRAWYNEGTAAQKRLGNWPFAAAWREWTPDEMTYFGLLRE